MTLTIAFSQFKWRSLVAFAMLVALVMPIAAEAACYEVLAPTSVAAQTVQAEPASASASIDVPAPAKDPVGKPSHTALCQHGHCGHAQVSPESPGELAALVHLGRRIAINPHEDLVANWLTAGPERPPQA